MVEVEVGAVIVATGWRPYDAAKLDHLGFGKFPNVITNVMMERLASETGPTGGKIVMRDGKTEPKSVAIIHCVGRVHDQFPDSHPLYIGHISREDGGHLTPHRSHQAGRDVDVSYYYLGSKRWFKHANSKNLDRERTWAFVRALITETDIAFPARSDSWTSVSGPRRRRE